MWGSTNITHSFNKNYQGRFSFINKKLSRLNDLKIKKANIKAIIFDLGYSYGQIKDPKKGLSFNSIGDLNMQMGLNNFSAKDVINKLDETVINELEVSNDLKDAMEGMLSPDLKEEISGNAEIREIFKISKIGTIAGCMILDGKVFRKSNVRLIRDGIVTTTTTLSSLKRFQDDVKEVSKGYDCGIQLKNYNDIKVGDSLEFYTELKVKKKIKS